MSLLSPLALKKKLESNPRAVLLSLESETSFGVGHIEGSLRSALYEMGFAKRVEALVPEKSVEVVLYATDADSHGPTFAAEKLDRAGYTAVYILDGGLAAWAESGYEIVGELTSPPLAEAESGVFDLDMEQSRLRWIGRNLANLHEGTLGIKTGTVRVDEGGLKSGQLVLDMKAISCSDIADTKLSRILVSHLEDHDFFDADRFPEAHVRLGQVTRRQDVVAGQPNYVGDAILTLRGVEHGVSFELVGGFSNGHFSLQGAVKIDRTDWGVLYGSARFFPRLGMHLVNDLIDLDLRLNFKRRS